MRANRYRIRMQTPMGERIGTMDAAIERGAVTGRMNLLHHSEPFEGSIDPEGKCSISGRLVTLMRTIPYTATGQITPEQVELSLQGGRNSFVITGKACNETDDNLVSHTGKEDEGV